VLNERWLAKRISDKIELALGEQIEAQHLGKGAPHPDTIRNFLNDKTVPSTKTLNIIAWYLHENQTKLFTFQEFKQHHDLSGNNQSPPLETERSDTSNFSPTKGHSETGASSFWKKALRKKVSLLILLFFLTVATSFLFIAYEVEANYAQSFTNSNLAELQDKGWFLFPDSIDLKKWDNPRYKNSGYLTLETHLGGSWVENRNYKPKSINILAHSISCGTCCVIKTKIVDFNPYQRYQQAGFFIYYNKKVAPSLLYTLETNEFDVKVQAVRRDAEYQNTNIIESKNYGRRSRISKFVCDEKLDSVIAETKIDSIVLKLIIEDDQYFFEYKTDENPWLSITSKMLPFGSPQYVGLVAYQGRPDIPRPVWPVADVIPANFASFSLTRCD
jgi:hypothetical protein